MWTTRTDQNECKHPLAPTVQFIFRCKAAKWVLLLLDRLSGRSLISLSLSLTSQGTIAIASPSLQEGIVSQRSQPASQILAGMEAHAIPSAMLSSAAAKMA